MYFEEMRVMYSNYVKSFGRHFEFSACQNEICLNDVWIENNNLQSILSAKVTKPKPTKILLGTIKGGMLMFISN